MINITFPDGSVRQYESGVTPFQVAESISPRFAADVLAAKVNGEEWDISRPIAADAAIQLFKWDDPEGKHAFWHSSAHLLAEALQELYPGVKFGIGPAIENGFYYDIDPGTHKLTADDFPRIEKKVQELVAKKEAIVRSDISKDDALKMFGDRGETYKCELISELEDGHITTYTQGAFTDLCRGPHLPSTQGIKAFKVLSLAGAYWRGDEKRNQLVRVYASLSPRKRCSTNISCSSKKPRSATTASSARKWNFSHSHRTSAQVCPSGFPKARHSATVSNSSSAKSRSNTATSR